MHASRGRSGSRSRSRAPIGRPPRSRPASRSPAAGSASSTSKFNELFYEGQLDAARYERWLRDNGVRFVAVPDATLDAHGEAEGALARREPPYLKPVRRLEHWTVYEVAPPAALAANEGDARIRVVRLGPDSATLDVERPGSAIVKVRWSPYWQARGACVERAGEWTRVDAPRRGRVELAIAFAPMRFLSHGRRCG